MSFVRLTIALMTLAFTSTVKGGNIGKVGSLTRFEFHNKDSGLNILASAEVQGDVAYEDVEEMLKSFNPSKDTKIVIHGWNNGDTSEIATLIINGFLPAFDYNVIYVDWSAESLETYPRAVQAVPKVATLVAQLVDILVANYSTSFDNIHMIGHSLGAQVAGIAGLLTVSGKVSRVTGLDPAKPLYHMSSPERLSPESATFVDVIHTCSNLLSFKEPLGHVDFYPNGGTYVQPGCFVGDMIGGKCSHGRSYMYFAESITNPENFPATQCDSWFDYTRSYCDESSATPVYMGENVSRSARGTYYLRTNRKSPFGQGNQS